jgi:hypothetical protein
MGKVIRPPEFARGDAATQSEPVDTSRGDPRLGRFNLGHFDLRRFDIQLAALVVALMGVAWILALAGAAFAVRALFVMCFATLAGRARRVGVPAPTPFGF